ncbi:MAG: hypothetical protein K2J01_00070 [Clostridiales bacterium]|nr:hypothetical protein [Clostridiales bacterium]
MKKLLTKLILPVACAMALATCLVGCGNNTTTPSGKNNGDGTTANSVSVETPLKYGTKYIPQDDVRKPAAQQSYLVFAENGTAKYHVCYVLDYSGTNNVYSYTLNLKYVFSDAHKTRVTCFYDSVEFDAADMQMINIPTDEVITLDVSENVLLGLGQYGYRNVYISENYLPQIPNFGSKED